MDMKVVTEHEPVSLTLNPFTQKPQELQGQGKAGKKKGKQAKVAESEDREDNLVDGKNRRLTFDVDDMKLSVRITNRAGQIHLTDFKLVPNGLPMDRYGACEGKETDKLTMVKCETCK